MAEKIILGIDPGTNIMGYGLILTDTSRMELIALGVVHLEKLDEQHPKQLIPSERHQSVLIHSPLYLCLDLYLRLFFQPWDWLLINSNW